ncbi:hypothetical protein [Gemmatimonas sp.]|uniref:hypothetical protein n=1 Tax=Gemmatimonas sp. TaxID=1962908 RepID=UPI0037C181BB
MATFARWTFRIVERECYRLFRGARQTQALNEQPESAQPAAPSVPQDLRMDLVCAIEQLLGSGYWLKDGEPEPVDKAV